MTKFYPIFMNLENRRCLVVGGGNIAWRKACALRDAGAILRIVSPDICDEIRNDFSDGHEILESVYESDHINDVVLVISATDSHDVNAGVAADCRKRNIPVNSVDQPEDCDFYVPAVLEEEGIQIAISTGGRSPAIAGWLKRELKEKLPPMIGKALETVRRARKKLIEDDPEGFDHRAKAFREFFKCDNWCDFVEGRCELSEEEVVEWISSYSD